MRSTRNFPLVAAVALLALPVIAGCSSSDSSSTTTKPASSSSTTASTTNLPATGSVNGFTLAVTSAPHTGKVGSTSITITAVLKGDVKAATLDFSVSSSSSAAKGKPATDQTVKITGPGTFKMPKAYSPTKAGHWAATVTYKPNEAGSSTLSVSGLPPVEGSSPPFPQLVTVVTED